MTLQNISIVFFVLSGQIFLTNIYADCVENCLTTAGCLESNTPVCKNSQSDCETNCKKETGDDVLFSGTKFQEGNTTLMQGERIAADVSAFGGGLRPEDLAVFEKNEAASTNARGTVSYSESRSRSSLFGLDSREEKKQETDLRSDVTVATRKNN